MNNNNNIKNIIHNINKSDSRTKSKRNLQFGNTRSDLLGQLVSKLLPPWEFLYLPEENALLELSPLYNLRLRSTYTPPPNTTHCPPIFIFPAPKLIFPPPPPTLYSGPPTFVVCLTPYLILSPILGPNIFSQYQISPSFLSSAHRKPPESTVFA